MRLLVTRPAEDAAPLAKLLEERGHEVTLEPLLKIEPIDGAVLDVDGVQALLFTSANGVRVFAGLSSERQLPVYAVGDSTARAATEAGFVRIESAGGDVEDLARLVREKCYPARGALLHPAASKLAGDLATLLGGQGFEVRRAVIYEAKAATALSPETIQRFQDGLIDGVLFFSPRTAESFASLAVKANIKDRLSRTSAFALSRAVAERLRELPFRRLRVAAKPEQSALLLCIDEEPMTSDAASPAPETQNNATVEAILPPPVRSTKRTLSAFLLGGVLGIALVAGSGALLWPMLVDSLKNEIAADEPHAEPPLSAGSDILRSFAARDESLSRRIADLEAKALLPVEKSAGLSAEDQERMNQRFSKMESEIQSLSQRRDTGPALLLSALMLREAKNAGRAFVKEIETLARLGEGDAELSGHLAALKPLAEKGVAAQEQLAQRFAALKPELLRSTMVAEEDLWSAVKRRLSALISVRRVDEAGQESVGLEGAVARAETELAKHHLAGAAANLSNLAGPAAELVKPWLGDALAHIEADLHIVAILDRTMAITVKP
ncbi:MAG: uroporphyrinogen-III synthase [Rhodospirillales bacterium]|nr:uroporphyrinogen-III synthase [Rhodospirillales bacterium]